MNTIKRDNNKIMFFKETEISMNSNREWEQQYCDQKTNKKNVFRNGE